MRSDVFRDVLDRRNQQIWLTLAFQSGFMNAGGYLACHRFVSHVTGYGAYVGMAAGEHDYLGAFEMALAPLFFLAGAAYSGWLVDRRIILGQEPRLRLGIVTLALMNLIIFTGEESGYLGEFGEPLVLQRDFELLFCLCFACGVQNGLFCGLTGGVVRTTHLTGPTTDLGVNLAKIATLPRDDPERARLVGVNALRTKIIVAFSGGSMIAMYVFAELTYEGFAIPFATSVLLIVAIHFRLLQAAKRATKAETAEIPANNQPVHASRRSA